MKFISLEVSQGRKNLEEGALRFVDFIPSRRMDGLHCYLKDGEQPHPGFEGIKYSCKHARRGQCSSSFKHIGE